MVEILRQLWWFWSGSSGNGKVSDQKGSGEEVNKWNGKDESTNQQTN